MPHYSVDLETPSSTQEMYRARIPPTNGGHVGDKFGYCHLERAAWY
ncbi:hypothetical protein L917_08439 [Phytophthora nicotianae]|uniref:Uncharacterized protein n=1 Tax=Phytophthora nicotianae TaxID=4792 RepID=W2L7I5_PHYNI|nr:hypothetical protein L917_08439 [Phytophthora nicotianae]